MKPFDEARYRLGTLCAQSHDYEGTGHSLRYRSSPSCVECAKAFRRRKDARLKAEREAAAPKYPAGMKKCPACETLIGIDEWRCGPCKKAYGLAYLKANPAKHKAWSEKTKSTLRKDRWPVSLWRGARASSKTRGLALEIEPSDIEQVWQRQKGLCYWTGVPLGIDVGPGHLMRVSLDRIDSNKGYVIGNIALACLFVNIGRRNRTPEETEAMLQAIAESMHTKLAAAI